MDWIKRNLSKLLFLFLLIETYFLLCTINEHSNSREMNRDLYAEKEKVIKENLEKDTIIENLSKNYKSLFEYINNPIYNQGRGVMFIYDLQYQGLGVEEVAKKTDIKYMFIDN